MNDDLPQLRFVLQALALPVIGQVRLVPDDGTRIGVLVEAFHAACPLIDATGTPLTAAQVAALTRLEEKLVQVCGQVTILPCSELALRQSREWQQVRLMAREALVQFQWPLEAPPLGLGLLQKREATFYNSRQRPGMGFGLRGCNLRRPQLRL